MLKHGILGLLNYGAMKFEKLLKTHYIFFGRHKPVRFIVNLLF